MIRTILDFHRCLFRLPPVVMIWMALLIAANGGGALWQFAAPEGRITLLVFLASALVMMLLFHVFGFVRLLGAAHIGWVPLVIWLGLRAPQAAGDPGLYAFILSVMVLNTLSLVIDTVDVFRYLRGEREPTVRLD